MSYKYSFADNALFILFYLLYFIVYNGILFLLFMRIWKENETARKLIKAAGTPIAAPSANLSGKPSPTACSVGLLCVKISHVLQLFRIGNKANYSICLYIFRFS